MLLKLRHISTWILVFISFLIFNCNSIGGTEISGRQQTSGHISPLKALRNERERARFRRRRIIMNNDGNDFIIQSKADIEPPGAFLDRRTTALVDSQVDSIFYCTGVFDMYYNPMEESDRVPDRMIKSEWVELMKQKRIDCLKIMTEFCHEHGKEIFWSMRMNDTHDSHPQRSDLMSQWKKDHPELLVASLDDRYNLPYGNGRWSSVNYGLQEVRDKVYRILSEICWRYDVDGIELDFLRHPILFKEHVWGQPVSREHCNILTGLIRRIRRMTEREGMTRNRPILVAIRVPDSTGFCRAIGIDLEQWLEEGLIDIVISGGSRRYEPWENLVKLGETYHVPVYACFEAGRLKRMTETENETNLLVWRGEALNAWRAGVNGVYTFNRFDPTDRLFREIGDPKLLEGLERVDRSVFINESLHAPPEEWIKDGRSYVRNDEALRKIRQAREKAKHRKRRIIMNNDGNDCRGRPGQEPTAENFLNIRTSALAGSQADSIFYCDGVFNYYCRRNTFKYYSRRPRTFDEYRTRNGKPLWGWTLIEKTGKSPLDLIVEFGNKHDIEVFWSMRMNDTHDSKVKNRDLLCDWKKNNLHCLMGRVDETFPYSSRWSAVNYDLEEVRNKVYHLIKGVCVNHNIDGIEMDFFRHPIYFRSQLFGEQPSPQQRDMMTGLIRRIRAMTEHVGIWRGRPILIAVRVPDSLDLAKNEIGLDVIQWLEEGLIDIIIGGGYFLFEPWEHLVAVGKKFNVPVYACLSESRLEWGGINMSLAEKQRIGAVMSIKYPGIIENCNRISELWHAEAHNAWRAGVDGIYTFNMFNPNNPLFCELGSPNTLMKYDRPYSPIVGWPPDWIESWFKNHTRYLKLPRQ